MRFVANQEKEVANSCDSLQIRIRRLQISAICCKSEEVHMLKVIVMRCKSGLRGCKLFLYFANQKKDVQSECDALQIRRRRLQLSAMRYKSIGEACILKI